MSSELGRALKTLQGFSALSESALELLATFASLRTIRTGETIFCQGEPSPYCFGILSGEVMIQRVSKDRRFPPKVLGVVGPHGLFGESSIFEDSPRAAMASASQDGQLVAIRGTELREWIRRNPEAAQPLLLALLQASQGRLHRTSHELAVIHGVGRLLGSEKPFPEQLGATLDFLKGSLDGLDDLIFYQRNAYWDEFSPVFSSPALTDLPVIPLRNEIAQKVNDAAGVQSFDPKTLRNEFATLKLPWETRVAMAVVPLFDRDKAQDSLEGLLFLASGRQAQAFSTDKQLLLTSVAQPLAEALTRRGRHEDSMAKERLQQSKQSFPR